MRIDELINDIRTRNLVLPEFQREYVWRREQSKQLMASLIKRYPVGGLLFWKTTDPPELKNMPDLPDHLGTFRVILDGQQRLTTLYMLLTGAIPPYYLDHDIQYDPRDLYFNVETQEFHYYQSSRMQENPRWQRVVECFNGTGSQVSAFDIAEKLTEDHHQAFKLASSLNGNLEKLRGILQQDLPIQTVPVTASLTEAIDIFDLVNSQGTKLSDAELALTHVTGKWAQARRVIKEKSRELAGKHFDFDLTFMTRALTASVKRRGLFETIHTAADDELKAGWKRLAKILDYLVNFLPHKAFIHSTEDLSTSNALVPLIVYLTVHDGKFPSLKAERNAIHWLYAALIKARYTAQTDQRLEKDIAIIVREDDPWDSLREQIEEQRGRIEVYASDFEGRGVGHPLFKAAQIVAKARGAVDWFNGIPLGRPHGKSYKIHRHHIFPKDVLYKNGYESENHMHGKMVNEIANRAFLTADTNFDLSNTPPAEYLPKIEEAYPGALASQYVPSAPELWRLERFEDFLAERRRLMAEAINTYMDHLVTESAPQGPVSVSTIIDQGESAQVEFKSTLQWDVRQSQVNKGLHQAVVKTVAALLNTEGGTLVIGVEDEGSIYGIEEDIASLGGTRDRFEQRLVTLLAESFGTEYAYLVKLRFETVDGKTVCILDVERAPEPVFAKVPGKDTVFYVRSGNATRGLDPQETVAYIGMHWDQ